MVELGLHHGCLCITGACATDKEFLLLKFPLSVVERADLACFEPPRDAVEVESMLGAVNGMRWVNPFTAYKHART